jgi:SNF2 family DNA or RNA helicase
MSTVVNLNEIEIKNIISSGIYSPLSYKIADLIIELIPFKKNTQIFMPNLDVDYRIAKILTKKSNSAFVTGLHKNDLHEYGHTEGEERISKTLTDNPEFYLPEDRFHLSYVTPSFNLNTETGKVEFIEVEDILNSFVCSRFSKDGITTYKHLIQLEQAFNAITIGGYVIALLPRGYQISDMRYNRFLESNLSTVLRINLSKELIDFSVYEKEKYFLRDQYGSMIKEIDRINYRVEHTSDDWDICIFFKSSNVIHNVDGMKCNVSRQFIGNMEWMEYSYSPFIKNNVTPDRLDDTVCRFKETEWFKLSIFQWLETLKKFEEASYSYNPFSLSRMAPIGLPSLEDSIVIRGIPKYMQSIREFNSIEEMKNERNPVRIKPTRSKVKLIPINESSKCLMLDLYNYAGYEDGVSKLDRQLSKEFESIRHYLISILSMNGLTPCILKSDANELKSRINRINLTLAPIERFINTREPSSHGIGYSVSSETGDKWELLYRDIGVRSVFKKQYEQWFNRAKKIKISDGRRLFDFQLDDVIIQCMKRSVVNASVMGLGKTRETLMSAILRGKKKVLIICPKKLIGTWQDEIEQFIIPWSRIVKRNWNGELLNIGLPKVIEYAQDVDNLSFFNIISYDKLKSTPRDGRFFKCPKCGTVVYSVRNELMRCPGNQFEYNEDPMKDNSCIGPLRRYKFANTQRNEHGKLIHQKYKVHKKTGIKVHWNENHPSRLVNGIRVLDKECMIIDTRKDNPYSDSITRECPRPPVMKKVDSMYDKTKIIVTGTETKEDDNGNKIEVPITTRVVRKCMGKNFHAKWSFSELLRWKFSMLIADEIMYCKNLDSQRSQALNHLTGNVRISCTGTPMKGMPQGILNYVNWTASRIAFPDYRLSDQGGLQRFLNIYKTDVVISDSHVGDVSIGGYKKQIPKIRNPERLRSELSPFLVRRVRNEPDVLKSIPDITCIYQDIKLEMDRFHKAFYKQWIDMFVEWFQAMKEEEEGEKVSGQNILAKIIYLFSASNNPHFMLDRLIQKSKEVGKAKSKSEEVLLKWLKIIKPYKGPPTAKMLKSIEIIEDAKLKRDKVLVGCSRKDTIDLGDAISKKKGYNSIVVDGRVSLETKKGQSRSERHLRVQNFRQDKYNVMWCGLKALAEGMNIPEANRVIGYDTTWEPADTHQFIGRVIRPQQTKTVFVYMLMHEGTIDEYMTALCYLKGRSHSEGIDAAAFDDLSSEMVPDFRQYAESIVDGTEDILKRNMWLKVEQMKKQWEIEGSAKLHEEDTDDIDDDDDDDENGINGK